MASASAQATWRGRTEPLGGGARGGRGAAAADGFDGSGHGAGGAAAAGGVAAVAVDRSARAAVGIEIPGGLPVSIQERAWSSPIWYEPASTR